MKTCTKCGTEKELSEFGKHRTARSGKQSWCKSCVLALTRATHAEKSRQAYEELERDEVTQTQKCSVCRIRKNFSEFPKNHRCKFGILRTCKDCVASKARPARANSPKTLQMESDLATQSRQCTRCDVRKPLSHFPKNKSNRLGVASMCKACACEVASAYWHSDVEKARLKQRKQRILRNYGKSLDWFETTIASQGNCCPCCGVKYVMGANGADRAVVDHCHVTGQLRGIICSTCNVALGYAKENALRLRNLACYVEKWELLK